MEQAPSLSCSVCGKKVGSWHPGGIHPACRKRLDPGLAIPVAPLAIGIQRMTQRQRDSILRRMVTKVSK